MNKNFDSILICAKSLNGSAESSQIAHNFLASALSFQLILDWEDAERKFFLYSTYWNTYHSTDSVDFYVGNGVARFSS